MNCCLFVIALLSFFGFLQCRRRRLSDELPYQHFRAVKLSGDSALGQAGFYLILFNRTIHRLEDEKTLSTLNIDIQSVESVSSLPTNRYKLQGAIPPIIYNKKDADDIIRVEVLKSRLLMGSLLSNLTELGGYINPSVAIFHGRMLLASGVAWTLTGMNDGLAPTDMVYIKWLNHSRYPFHSNVPYLGVGMTLQPIKNSMNPEAQENVLGQDPRLVLFQDKLHFTFTNRHVRPHLRLGMARLGLQPSAGDGSSQGALQTEQFFFQVTFDSPHPQKNWVPFVHAGELLYLSRINPLEVVRVSAAPDASGSGSAQVIGGAPHVETHWAFGEIRGGSNAIQLDEHRYLAIFHSSTQLPSHYMITYFMGAFVFSAQGGAFRLLAISPLPIMEEGLYNGPWHPFRNRRIDYCVFPSTLLRDEWDPDVAHVSFGHQDVRGFLADLRISQLLQSLVPVHYDLTRPRRP